MRADEEKLDSEQPTAPYLDAIVGFGFRGPGRFNVPGHKGGQGADPGLRHAIGASASSQPPRTSTPSSATPSGGQAASTSRAIRAGRGPTRAYGMRSARTR